jgi:DNA-binding LacI/PurR family transcriptional regulator
MTYPGMPSQPSQRKTQPPSTKSAQKKANKITSTADLAAKLDLSQWSVSRAINGHPGVSEGTRRRVIEAMNESGFSPNPYARGLRGRSLRTVGICFSRLKVPILEEKVFKLQDFFRSLNIHCLLETTRSDAQTERKVLDHFRSSRVDGVVLFQSKLPATEISSLLGAIPLICIDPRFPQTAPTVALDRRLAMHTLIEHLLDLGHTRFALLGITQGDTWRWPPLEESARRRGLDPAHAFQSVRSPEAEQSPLEMGLQSAMTLLTSSDRPTAFICQNDWVATGVLQAARELNLTIPGDLSVTGFDNLDISRILRPYLTTVEQHSDRTVAVAGQMLLDQMSEIPVSAQTVLITATVVIGDSTGPLRKF